MNILTLNYRATRMMYLMEASFVLVGFANVVLNLVLNRKKSD